MSTNGIASHTAPAASKQSLPPNQTLYINNLADKIHKNDMIRSLYLFFSPQAHILDIVVLKTKKTRGQAHVVCKDHFAATQAMRTLQGAQFLGKPIRIQYAKGRSKVVATLEGSASPVASTARQAAPTATSNKDATDLQKQIFGRPPQNRIQTAASGRTQAGAMSNSLNAPSPQGTKRPREDDQSDDPMEDGDDDDGEAMDVSDED